MASSLCWQRLNKGTARRRADLHLRSRGQPRRLASKTLQQTAKPSCMLVVKKSEQFDGFLLVTCLLLTQPRPNVNSLSCASFARLLIYFLPLLQSQDTQIDSPSSSPRMGGKAVDGKSPSGPLSYCSSRTSSSGGHSPDRLRDVFPRKCSGQVSMLMHSYFLLGLHLTSGGYHLLYPMLSPF